MTGPAPAPDPAAEDAPDPFVVRGEGRVCMLRELAEMGMDVARAICRKAVAEAERAEAAVEGDAAPAPARPAASLDAAFKGVSRAIRLTLALEARFDEALRDLIAGVVRRREIDRQQREAQRAQARARAEAETFARNEARAEQVRDLVGRLIDREAGDPQERDDLFEALNERLDDDPAYDFIGDAPLREVIEHICADLQLTPDWSRWTGLDWGPREPFFRPAYSPYHQSARKPLPPTDAGP